MAKSARLVQLQDLFDIHLQETQTQVERLDECFEMLGTPARAKPCKGMMGLVEEGQEVMEASRKKDDAAADLALIGAAQRVEHYEIAGYKTARNLAQQLHFTAVAQLLTKSLGEEENADQLLNQVARVCSQIAGSSRVMKSRGPTAIHQHFRRLRRVHFGNGFTTHVAERSCRHFL
jgi:Mn-containing catalase